MYRSQHSPARPNARGFTLIEILVVIVIIGLLTALLFPVFAASRRKARETTCLSNLRQIGQALQMYQQDHGGQAPAGKPFGSAWRGVTTAGEGSDPLKSYGTTPDIYLCPEWVQSHGPYTNDDWRLQLDLSKPIRIFPRSSHESPKRGLWI